MKTLLLTGFAPWDCYDRNASWELLRGQEGVAAEGWQVRTLEVPVSWERAWPVVADAWDDSVRAMVAFGQAEDDEIRIERFAVNAASSKAVDVDGAKFAAPWIIPGADHALHTRLPWQRLERALADASLPVRTSLHAGDYLCNHLFYRILHRIEHERASVTGGFVHVPTLARMPLEQLVAARRVFVASLLEHVEIAQRARSAVVP